MNCSGCKAGGSENVFWFHSFSSWFVGEKDQSEGPSCFDVGPV